MTKKFLFALLLFCFLTNVNAQKVTGRLLALKDLQPIAGGLLLDKDQAVVAYSNANGEFSFEAPSSKQILVMAAGFNPKTITITENDTSSLDILLEEEPTDFALEEVVVGWKIPTLKEFSSKEITHIDVYNSPNSYADVIRATSSLPSSTATDDGAEISLRGSTSHNSMLFLNNVPIYKSFKGGNTASAMGTFSIVSNDFVQSTDVFAGNPPLYLGRSTAGLIQANTIEKLHGKHLSLSLNMTGIGAYYGSAYASQKKSFFQISTNHGHSKIFKMVNDKAYPDLHYFRNHDLTFNTRIFVGKSAYLNFLSLYNYDQTAFDEHILAHKDYGKDQENRWLNIANFVQHLNAHTQLQVNAMYDTSRQNFQWGNLDIANQKRDFFGGANVIYERKKIGLNIGLDYDARNYHFGKAHNTIAFHYDKTHPTTPFQLERSHQAAHLFLVSKYKVFSKLLLSYSSRATQELHPKSNLFLSNQFSARYAFNNNNSLLASLGNYNNFAATSLPPFDFSHYQSKQISLDFQHKNKKGNIDAALYANKITTNTPHSTLWETPENTPSVQFIAGAELLTDFVLMKKIRWQNTFSFFKNNITAGHRTYPNSKSISPIIKTNIQYHFKPIGTTFNISLSHRSGTFYTPVVEHYQQNGLKMPIFAPINSMQHEPYYKIDLNFYKLFPIKGGYVVPYVTLSNVLNKKNIVKEVYNHNYQALYKYHPGRMLFLGLTISGKK